MASDGEDDYLSDKFLLESAAADTSKKPLTYAERRKQAQKQSETKNAQNRIKSRRVREAESLEQGLSQSLFERVKVEEQELGAKNKAMSMMFRMGFKPGESLGRTDGSGPSSLGASNSAVSPAAAMLQEYTPSASTTPEPPAEVSEKRDSGLRHRTAPLAVDIWAGKKGVGLGKRAPSPGMAERTAKVARIEEETKHETYRSRTREAFEQRRVLGQLSAASRTLIALDEKAGIQFNILSLNPQEPETFPSEILEALSAQYDDDPLAATVANVGAQESESERLRKQMQLDALQPLETLSPNGGNDDDETIEVPKKDTPLPLSLSEETINSARDFLRLDARNRLTRILQYLREKYHYCFWCGTQYSDKPDLDGNCPGENEEAHE